MSLEDPQEVTIGAGTATLPRVSVGPDFGVFRSEDGSVELRVSHAYGKRKRTAVRLTNNKVDTDPLVPTVNVPYSMSVTLVIDTPKVGYSVADQKLVVDALRALLAADSAALVTQVLGGQS